MPQTVPKIEETDDMEMDLEFVNTDTETTCTICSAEFLDKSDLDIHLSQVHKQGTKLCHFCTESYPDLVSYAAHIKDHHFNEIRCCRYCTKVVKNMKHEKKHLSYSKDYYSCSECDGLFAYTRQLTSHEKIEHPEGLDSFYLPCMPYLSSLLNLNAASVLQSTSDSYLFCKSCEFTSVDLKSYTQHLAEECCASYVCDQCSELFSSKGNLNKHLKSLRPCNDYEKVKCINCKNEIHYLRLRDHLVNCRKIQCIICNIEFRTVEQLSLHQQYAHPRTIENAEICNFCQGVYVGKKAIRKHIIRTHKRFFHLYKYMCKICDGIFQHPQKLFAHYFLYHKDLEPYTCKICNLKFRVRKNFTIHIKLEHKSEGFVEFDDHYLVYFTDRKSDHPFIPECVIDKDAFDSSSSDNENDSVGKESLKDDVKHVKDKIKPNSKTNKQPKQIIKRKQNKKPMDKTNEIISSDDEPLLEVRKRIKRAKSTHKLRKLKGHKNFKCQICKKNCYTLQNYNNHMNMHKKSDSITCVKCKKEFQDTNELIKHQQTDHSSSLLTETLKKVLEKRKKTVINPTTETSSQKFSKTIKKVNLDKISEPATITIANNNLSVKNFLETFTPETNEGQKLRIEASLTIKRLDSPYHREVAIKMHECKKESDINLNTPVKLKMPQKFQSNLDFTPEITISILQQPNDHDYEVNDLPFIDDDDRQIPEVAEEVMLEETAEESNVAPKIVIPQLPHGYPALHVATLHSQAPFYKIVKVASNNTTQDSTKTRPETIQLKDGTKLVSANPLAHLLGDKQVEQIIKPYKTYYKPRPFPEGKNIKSILSDAIQKLVQKPNYKRKPRTTQNKRDRKPNKTKMQELNNDMQEATNDMQEAINDLQESGNVSQDCTNTDQNDTLQVSNDEVLGKTKQENSDMQEIDNVSGGNTTMVKQLQDTDNDLQVSQDGLPESHIDMPVIN